MKNNNLPQISVVMSVYSEPTEWIQEAIESILDQTFSDFELIIINDNPNRKENKGLLDEYQLQDNRIVVIENKQNIGLTKSLNKGLKIAKGKYIARMDADDISMLNRFQIQYDFMERNEDYIVCGANIECFGIQKKNIKYSQYITESSLFVKNPFAHPLVMLRGRVLRDNKMLYNENFEYAQDYEFWSRLYNFGSFYNVQEVLLKYRVTPQQISKKNKFKQQFFSGQVRRLLFQHFCENNRLNYSLKKDIGLCDIKEYRGAVQKDQKWSVDVKKNLCEFKYYLYRSVDKKDKLKVLLYLFLSMDFYRLGIEKNLKIIMYLFAKKITTLVK